MNAVIVALVLFCTATLAKPMCPEPTLVEDSGTCLISMPNCLKSQEDVDAALTGIKGCAEHFPEAPCLIYMQRDEQLGFTYHCGLPDDSAEEVQ